MKIDRRQFLAVSGAGLLSCAGPVRPSAATPSRLDQLLLAHAGRLPERAGAGANHYPMAAEVLAAYGYDAEIDDAWIDGASLYGDPADPLWNQPLEPRLGEYGDFDAWCAYFRAGISNEGWRSVLGAWAPRLAPGISAAVFHGVIRAGHAARALTMEESPARMEELAIGLAYWAARYAELPNREGASSLASLDYPWLEQSEAVAFDDVGARLAAQPLATITAVEGEPRDELQELVRECSIAFLEMLVAERYRIWNLHIVTGPAAVEWLLPYVNDEGARLLVAHVRHAALATFAAFGAPYVPRANQREELSDWADSMERAVASRSVHGIKLIDALARFDRDDDPIWRSVAAHWFEWV